MRIPGASIGAGLAAWACVACGSARGRVEALVPREPALGVQRLTPGVSAHVCRSTVLGIPVGSAESALDEALQRLLAHDASATVVSDVEVRWSWLSTGLYNRTCVDVRGDAGRVVSTVIVPAGHLPPHK